MPTRAVEDLEPILQDEAGKIAPESCAERMDQEDGADRSEEQEDPDDLKARRAAVDEEARDSGDELSTLRGVLSFMSVEVHGHAGLHVCADGVDVRLFHPDASG